MMPSKSAPLVAIVAMAAAVMIVRADGAVTTGLLKNLTDINRQGPFLGVVIPNAFEMSPLLQSTSFVPSKNFPYLDYGGRRFRIGKLVNENVVIVMTGLGMLNAGVATQLLLTLFHIKGVLHFGIAGNANPNLQIGDVVIPQYWAHTGLWNWQRFGDGPEDELSLEANGDYTREIGYLRFADYNINVTQTMKIGNLLNNIWYQPEEIFPVSGNPEVRQHVFWVPAAKDYCAKAINLEGLKLNRCVNSTFCLEREPMVLVVERGSSANKFIDNAAYREFLNVKFNVTAIDMESAAVALVCQQQVTPFIAIRALSDLAGGGSSQSNEAAVFASLAAQNAVDVAVKFVASLAAQNAVDIAVASLAAQNAVDVAVKFVSLK